MRHAVLPRFGLLALAIVALAACSTAQVPARPASDADLAGTVNAARPNSGSFERWSRVIARFGQQRQHPAALCAAQACPRAQWDAVVAELKRLPLRDRVVAANAVFNRLRYVPAEKNWNDVAYWATPYEFLIRGGQCQDYAIAK